MNKDFKEKLKLVPELPGSYQMLDEAGRIIYVGKAKNLRNRLKSYFTGSHDQKTQSLIDIVGDFSYIVTSSELEAFLLELSLIKTHSPRFNIMLMDDKTYPYIEITSEAHPRLVITRKPKKAKNFFGPYPDVASARETLRLLNRIFLFRKCLKMPHRACFYYHIHQCLGPCEHEVAQDTYKEMIESVKDLLQGNITSIKNELKAKMQKHAFKLEFEKAKEYKDLIEALSKTTMKQNVIFKDLGDRDIFNYYAFDNFMAVSTMFMRGGRIVFSKATIIEYYADEEDAFLDYVVQFYERHPLPKEVLFPESVDLDLLHSFVEGRGLIPRKGKKRQLVEMAKENAKIYFENELGAYLKRHDRMLGALGDLADLIDVARLNVIEAFDNSHTMGTNPVSALVVFRNGLPEKKSYRKYQIKSTTRPDDYNAMKEVVYRRYQRLLYEHKPLPDLLIMDGGLAQVHAAREVLASLYLELPVIGLKKDAQHKTDALIDLSDAEIKLDRHANLYVLLSKIQDEAHRFAITYHRAKRAREVYASILDQIPRIGKATKMKLLTQFKTIENIKNATDKELTTLGLKKDQINNLRVGLTAAKDK